ncbi:MAG: IclR family transcriptional regulator [Betaproteobacteria bacterium RIFCSPLOWO2_12_FULL_66_14]|nr:MAG: IclR family transcriptional regulator [Betaproteobacteria bacterium RIFCSPLOWO2_12_FULL_66_14]
MPQRTSMIKPGRARVEMPAGTQAIQRASLLVRLIASRGRSGLRLAELVEHSGFTRPTVRRMLKCLVVEGMVMQEEASHRYFLGPLIFELGLAAAPQFNLRDICHPSVQRIADRTGDTVFLSVRSGYDSVCIDRAEGSFPIKALTLDVGTRRPLGVGAGGMALLMPLPEAAVADIVERNAPRFAAYKGLTAPALLRLLKRSRESGYALNDHHMTDGAISMGMPIVNPFADPFASISVGAIASRMSAERRPEVAAALRTEVRQLARLLSDTATP